jgi:hypothetical protein
MQSKTAKLVNEERVIALLECYGADADNWPEEERAAALVIISSSAELQQRQRETRQLDELMGLVRVRESLDTRADAAIVAHVINTLPEQRASNTVNLRDHMAIQKDNKAPKRRSSWWTYGAAAAAAVVFLAVSVVMQQPSQPLQPTPLRTATLAETVSQEEMDQWLWQQATGLNEDLSVELAPDDVELPITFMAMVELDLSPNDE